MWQWNNDEPFGNNQPVINNIEFNLRFPGQYFDKESNLSYNYFRDYNSKIGRYAESDPIGLTGGISTYGYVGSNPLSGVDSFGLYSNQDFLNDATDWGAGFGDNLTFGLTKVTRSFFNIGSVDISSNFYNGGDIGGFFFSLGFGLTKGGLKASVSAKSIHWSHWIPDRYLRPIKGTRGGKIPKNPQPNDCYKSYLDNYLGRLFINSKLNGNYESALFHRLTDPFAYKFKPNKIPGEDYGLVRSQINRVPYWLSYSLYGASFYMLNKD